MLRVVLGVFLATSALGAPSVGSPRDQHPDVGLTTVRLMLG